MTKADVVDFLDRLLLKSPTPITDVKSKKSATYTLIPTPDARISIPSDATQRVTRTDDGKVVVEVTPITPAKRVKFPYKGKDKEILKALEPTQYLQSDDERIIELAKQAVGNAKYADEAAIKIESFVNSYIDEKDLSVGYATAAEVAQSKQGDCSEHAVLAAAMCRAVGIPARVAIGLVYVDDFVGHKNVFGGHAWTQVYIGDKWIPIDATRSPGGYGVGHITLAAGSGDPADFFSMANTLGYFQIEKIVLK